MFNFSYKSCHLMYENNLFEPKKHHLINPGGISCPNFQGLRITIYVELKYEEMCEIDLLQDSAASSLKIQYRSSSAVVFYDLCDEGGRVITTGKIDNGEAIVSTKALSEGVYTIFIVDGSQLKKANFRQIKSSDN